MNAIRKHGFRWSAAILCVVALASVVDVSSFRIPNHNEKKKHSTTTTPPPDVVVPKPPQRKDRRHFLHQCTAGLAAATVVVVAGPPSVANAGEVGARITKAVTTSELGISVRRSVVRGAQVFDSLDLEAERFSDRFGLGSERSKRPGRPRPKVIPDPQPLDHTLAEQILQLSDETFCKVADIQISALKERIQVVRDTVKPSFERSGLAMSSDAMETGDLFNFASYVHFKSYSDLIIERNVDFRTFKQNFETEIGDRLAGLLLSSEARPLKSLSSNDRVDSLRKIVETIDGVCKTLVSKGFVAQIDLAPLEPDDVEDWSNDLSDLSWSIALDGDVTLKSQLLLQEQGLRLYPNYGRYIIQSLLCRLQGQDITTEDYYMDTDYSSDPDKFEVKEVLVNISIESK